MIDALTANLGGRLVYRHSVGVTRVVPSSIQPPGWPEPLQN